MQLLRSPRFILDAMGTIIAGVLYTTSLYTQEPLQDLLVGVATSFVFATILDLLIISQSKTTNRELVQLFGDELVHRETVMVYPDFVLHEDVRSTLVQHNQQLIFQRPLSPFSGLTVHRIDVPSLVAVNDIQALLYVSSIFDGTTGSPNIMLVDSKVIEDCDRSFISFGLSSNDCTHLYIHETSNPLFTIVEDGHGSEYIRLRSGQEYRSTALRQYGLVLRYAPDPQTSPHRRWMLVAGLGPVGTTGAGWYLSRQWRSLAKQVPSDHDFVAIVSVGSYTDRTPRLEEVLVDAPGRGTP